MLRSFFITLSPALSEGEYLPKKLPLLPPSAACLLPFFFSFHLPILFSYFCVKSCYGSKYGETFFPFSDSPSPVENLAEGWHCAFYFPLICPVSE